MSALKSRRRCYRQDGATSTPEQASCSPLPDRVGNLVLLDGGCGCDADEMASEKYTHGHPASVLR